MPFVDIVLVMKIHECMSCFGSVSPFHPYDNLALYTDRSRSPGRLRPSLVCQVVMPWTRPEGEGWRASRSPESRCSGTPL